MTADKDYKIAGLFKTYNEYLNSWIWKDKRDFFINHVGYCQICGCKKCLLVHHINYDSVGNESILDIQVICQNCHRRIHHGK